MKIVVNKCFGGFGVSEAVYKELGMEWDGYGYLYNEDFGIESDNYNAYRTNKKLIEAIERIGEKTASGAMAELRVVEIPDGIEFDINNYDGIETVHENHRSW
jgi:hypothetical protein